MTKARVLPGGAGPAPLTQKPPPMTLLSSSKLHIGCGNRRIPGWINADAVPGVGEVVLDLALSPLSEGVFTCIYGSHVLEHCYAGETPGILSKLFRALMPGGTLRLSVPDLYLVVKNCIEGHSFGSEWAAMSVLYGADHSRKTSEPDRHKQIFWHGRLVGLLTGAGFKNIRPWKFGQYPEIDKLQDWATWPRDAAGASLISLNLEAERP